MKPGERVLASETPWCRHVGTGYGVVVQWWVPGVWVRGHGRLVDPTRGTGPGASPTVIPTVLGEMAKMTLFHCFLFHYGSITGTVGPGLGTVGPGLGTVGPQCLSCGVSGGVFRSDKTGTFRVLLIVIYLLKAPRNKGPSVNSVNSVNLVKCQKPEMGPLLDTTVDTTFDHFLTFSFRSPL